VFRYSQRKGTPAAEMISAASHSEIKKRSEILLKISFDKRREMLKKYIGRAMDILITDGPEKISGLTHNYIRVIVKNGKALKGRLYRARLIALNENNTISGELL
ncbi:MAG: tRNA (N(6)-L-threonylcarbamoyladenosine(37)-C(2))-methylthiotransferase MtaB, partial [Deltaproteobacteria bacterium]|nr:tRNA (N(6)-L-threonylcarbamoyladenosine(37)-C(2))-methylthiotransferase MtaB [Deltaproteobacteria bacterium]